MVNNKNDRILIVSRGVWDDTKGTSSTLTNIFQNYDSENIAQIYIESTSPNTNCCHRFFQISEISLIHKLFRWRTKTGRAFDTSLNAKPPVSDNIARQEASVMDFVRRHRSDVFSIARELLWMFNGWKSRDLKEFIIDYNPDVIWLDGSPLPLMNRLFRYVLNTTTRPAVIFIQDDIYTYKSCKKAPLSLFYKWCLRRNVKRVVKQCSDVFVISPKMKREYDAIFGINSKIITKGIDVDKITNNNNGINHSPVKLVYLGQVIYGRIYTLIAIANAIKKINENEVKLQFSIYTNNQISDKQKEKLLICDNVVLMPAVPYSEVPKVINENDVVVFVESFERSYKNLVRLSFSTKISDYLASGKCIFAIGPQDIAPMEYFKDEDSAIVATSIDDIEKQLIKLTDDSVIKEYTEKACKCALKNHNKEKLDATVFNTLNELSEKR